MPTPSSPGPVSIREVLAGINAPWMPESLAVANGAVVRVVRLLGEFAWHHHDEDELFLCWEGAFRIELADRDPIDLTAGDLFVVRAGIEHRPVAAEPAVCLVFEPEETQQYGN